MANGFDCVGMMGYGTFGLLYTVLYPLILIGILAIIVLVVIKLWQQINKRKSR